MWIPTVWYFEKCRLRQACAVPNSALKLFGQLLNSQRIIKRLAKALIRLRLGEGWSEALLMATTTLLEISCRGSYMLDSSVTISAFIHKLCKWAHLYCWQFNQLVTNGLSHPYHLDESTFILGAAGMTFHFYFAFYYIYIGSGTTRFITVETRMFPDCAGIAPTPSQWRHGCSRRLPGLSRYLTAFPVTPGECRLF